MPDKAIVVAKLIAIKVFPSFGIEEVTKIVLHVSSGTCANKNSRLVRIIRIASAELERLVELIISSLFSERGKSPKKGIVTFRSTSIRDFIFVSIKKIKNKTPIGMTKPRIKAIK